MVGKGACSSDGVIYLDYLATTPCDPAVVEAMLPWFMQHPANAGSLHVPRRRAEEAVEQARAELAAALHVSPQELI